MYLIKDNMYPCNKLTISLCALLPEYVFLVLIAISRRNFFNSFFALSMFFSRSGSGDF